MLKTFDVRSRYAYIAPMTTTNNTNETKKQNTSSKPPTGIVEYSCGCTYPTWETPGYYDHHCATCRRILWTRRSK